jgi:hypothetical protein
MPLGGVGSGANANEGGQTEDVLPTLVVHPPAAGRSLAGLVGMIL